MENKFHLGWGQNVDLIYLLYKTFKNIFVATLKSATQYLWNYFNSLSGVSFPMAEITQIFFPNNTCPWYFCQWSSKALKSHAINFMELGVSVQTLFSLCSDQMVQHTFSVHVWQPSVLCQIRPRDVNKPLTNLAWVYTRFFYKKTIFLPQPQFFQHNARNQAEIFLIFFIFIFISLFSLILYLIRFNPNNRHDFLKNGDTKAFEIRKKPKIYSFLKIAAEASEAGDFLNILLWFFGF